MYRALFAAALATLLLAPVTTRAQDQAPDNAELYEIIKRQQEQIDELLRRLDDKNASQPAPARPAGTGPSTTELLEIIEAQQDEIDQLVGKRQSDLFELEGRTVVGGYGELHYNNLDADDSARDFEEFDFHRFVLFFGHEFNESVRFFSEVELEHSLVEDTDDGSGPGEIEIEQAYVEFDFDDYSSIQAGLFIVPVGILNEIHEPPTFYGVERNDVENIIIPTTWREAGVQYIRRFGEGWQLNVGIHSGLEIPTSSFRIRSGRQSAARAAGDALAVTSRLKYTGIRGLEVAGTISYQDDPSQEDGDGLDSGILYEAHAAYTRGKFGLRALWAQWDFDGDVIEAAGDADSQSGWYIEPSYKLTDKFGIYARYSDVDAARAQDNFEQAEIGFNWWPHDQVVFKFDIRSRDHDLASESGRDFDGFDLGVGYQF
ncbi:MAG: OprO/OprP family phosphate-selective porin [Gammaproteobacteria bacterium]|nr:OprO/OprP family phosphate-selective porin [Gammaproteobacteria bacterium]